jgi:hypothetical protein
MSTNAQAQTARLQHANSEEHLPGIHVCRHIEQKIPMPLYVILVGVMAFEETKAIVVPLKGEPTWQRAVHIHLVKYRILSKDRLYNVIDRKPKTGCDGWATCIGSTSRFTVSNRGWSVLCSSATAAPMQASAMAAHR